jgi:diguanylate cyclase (GGDEF)-like protein
MKNTLGEGLYTEIMFSLIYRRYPSDEAREKWEQILAHKRWLKDHLHRDVGIQAATMDYFVNIDEKKIPLMMIDEEKFLSLGLRDDLDTFTGLLMEPSFMGHLVRELRRSRRYRKPLSLLAVDIDDLGSINETCGEPFGDFVVRQSAQIVRENVRATDTVGRGEVCNFLIVLPECPVHSAQPLAERLRVALEKTPFLFREGDPPIPVTVSVGIAGFPRNGADAHELVDAACDLLFHAKELGKNRVELD